MRESGSTTLPYAMMIQRQCCGSGSILDQKSVSGSKFQEFGSTQLPIRGEILTLAGKDALPTVTYIRRAEYEQI